MKIILATLTFALTLCVGTKPEPLAAFSLPAPGERMLCVITDAGQGTVYMNECVKIDDEEWAAHKRRFCGIHTGRKDVEC